MKISEKWICEVAGSQREVFPDYSRAAITEDKSVNGWFGITSLDVDLIFKDTDFIYLKSFAIDTEITLYFQTSINNGATWSTKGTFIFTRFDMEVNEDEQIIKLKPESKDIYRDLLDGLDKQYDILNLAPELETITYYKRPLLQIYFAGLSQINNYLGAQYWETTTDEIVEDHDDLINTYKFGLIDHIVFIQGNSEVLTKDISGRYDTPDPTLWNDPTLPAVSTGRPVVFYHVDDTFEMRIRFVNGSGYQWRIFDLSDGSIIYTTAFQSSYFYPYDSLGGFDGALFTDVDDGTKQVRCFGGRCYGRLLSNVGESAGVYAEIMPHINQFSFDPWSASTTYSKNDLVTYDSSIWVALNTNTNEQPDSSSDWAEVAGDQEDIINAINYIYSFPITDNIIAANNLATDDPATTRFGKFHQDALFFPGQYFIRQTGANGPYYPCAQSRWTEASFWIYYTSALLSLQDNGAKAFTTEAMYWDSCINTILAENEVTGGDVTMGRTSEYSDFFYNASNPMKGDSRRLFIVPVSNIILGDYSDPAKKGITRLSELLMIPKVFHNCDWFAEDGKLRIEHVKYLRQGKSYTGDNIGVDYTTSLDPKTNLSWNYGQRIFRYDKQNIPSRLEWNFLGEGSEPVRGLPIDVLDSYVSKGNIEKYNLENFTADIDFVNSQGTTFLSSNGFVVLEAEQVGDDWVVPFVTVEVETGEEYIIQNGYLAMAYLHPLFWKDNAPGSTLKMNRNQTTANSVRRHKIQPKVKFPINLNLDIMELVKTVDGNALPKLVETDYSEGSQTYDLMFEID